MFNESDSSSSVSLNSHLKSPPFKRPAYVSTFCLATSGLSASYSYIILDVSKLLYVFSPCNDFTELGTVSSMLDTSYASKFSLSCEYGI